MEEEEWEDLVWVPVGTVYALNVVIKFLIREGFHAFSKNAQNAEHL